MRARFGWVLGIAALVALAMGLCGGCSDDAPKEQDAGVVQGKTPVVRPEDVTAKGEGSSVLAPDYRRDLEPELARKEFAAASARSGKSPKTATSSGVTRAADEASPSPQVKPVPTDTRPAGPVPTPAKAEASMVASGAFPVPGCRQLVLVVAPDINAHAGSLRRLTRQGPDKPWQEEGERVACILGRAGLGVGRGLLPNLEGPPKRQGDHRTPAGLFTLPEGFGYAQPEAAAKAGVRVPYKMVTDRTVCVTDARSADFGRILGPGERSPGDKGRQERMKRTDNANSWGVVIGHNLDNPDPEAGSCLFINVRPAGGSPTGGSIGLPETQAAALTAWLDPAAGALLAVLPENTYQQVKKGWGLP